MEEVHSIGQAVDEGRVPPSEGEHLGRHAMAEFWGARGLTDVDLLRSATEDAVRCAGATLVQLAAHCFGPEQGVTVLALLAESHLSIHTWPERAYAAVDVFTCGSADPLRAIARLQQIMRPTTVRVAEYRRGAIAASAERVDGDQVTV